MRIGTKLGIGFGLILLMVVALSDWKFQLLSVNTTSLSYNKASKVLP